MRWALPFLLLIAAVAAQGRPAHVETARALYRAESCWQCHVHAGDKSFPPLVGTRRAGPVIGAPGLPRSPEWYRALFYAPRTLLAESQMPAYARYFTPHANDGAVRAFVDKYDTRDGSMNQDGIVTRAEFTGKDWEAALKRLDASKNDVISL
ncbi:MAG: hypothetical protein OER88_06015, partial [Planctomycetota bacterium]|nr:hypothetical protein [Planctomycetota bacterium]